MSKLQPRHVDLGNSNTYFQRQDASAEKKKNEKGLSSVSKA